VPNRRTGKIARLPKAIRDSVNLMLRDGDSYLKIIAKLNEMGYADFNEPNMSAWKAGGHEDWLNEQAFLDDMKAKREFALEIVSQNEGGKIHEAGLNLAASQIFELLQDFDATAMKQLIATDPENYSRIVGALAKISKESLNYEKYRSMVEKAREVIADESTLTQDEQRARLKEILK